MATSASAAGRAGRSAGGVMATASNSRAAMCCTGDLRPRGVPGSTSRRRNGHWATAAVRWADPTGAPDPAYGTISATPLRREDREMQFGRYYEEFEVGATYKHWPGKTVTEYDDHLFCLLTMNHHPLHMDANYAEKTTDFGKNVVVGNYIYSLLLGMSVPDISGKAIANLEVESLKHVKPTFHGDTIYGETTVLDKTESRSKDDRGVVHVETRGYNQDGTVVCVFRRKVMVPKRSYGESRGGEQPGRPEPADG
ncbi:MAG TPA: MaoC family dehydratase [Candidatus Eisenbacteria bacterium]|nr:MaoC family dehydratase [Candidatus Eisenbacteria bacterium]